MNPQAESLPLRDIHLPDPVSWWPPAPGWWILLGLLLGAVAVAGWLRRQRRKTALRRSAQQSLQEISDSWRQSGDRNALARDLSVLLRRLGLSRFSRREVAGLTGRAWLDWLDRSLPGNEFTHGVGRVLVEAPYQGESEFDGDALLQLCQRWLQALPDPGANRP